MLICKRNSSILTNILQINKAKMKLDKKEKCLEYYNFYFTNWSIDKTVYNW